MKKLIPLFMLVFMLAGCAETEFVSHIFKQVPSDSSATTYKVGNPYMIQGRQYFPQETYTFSETGIASWYGPDFHGKATANGEVYDMYQLTAAHRTLQMPSVVRVTNLENGRSLKLKINDRGPFSKNRVIDVSKKGAELLGFKNRGTARVRIDLLPEESKIVADAAARGQKLDVKDAIRIASARRGGQPAPVQTASYEPAHSAVAQPVTHVDREILASVSQQQEPFQNMTAVQPVKVQTIGGEPVDIVPVSPTSLYVQVGAFTVRENAVRLADAMRQSYNAGKVFEAMVGDKTFYRVRVGPVQTTEQADALLSRIWSEKGLKDARIVVE